MQDRQHRAVTRRIDEIDALPAARERTRLRFAIADHGGDEQIGIVHHCAERVHQYIAELAALMDRARRRHTDMARHAARCRELPEQLEHAGCTARYLRKTFRVATLQPHVRDQGRTAMTGTRHVDGVQIVFPDQPIDVHVDQVEPGRGAPMAKQPRFNVVGAELFAQQRVRHQVDLSDSEIIRGTPPGIYPAQFISAQGLGPVRHLAKLRVFIRGVHAFLSLLDTAAETGRGRAGRIPVRFKNRRTSAPPLSATIRSFP